MRGSTAVMLSISACNGMVSGMVVRLTPIGPFCPFRSAACADGSALSSAMGDLTQTKMPQFAMEVKPEAPAPPATFLVSRPLCVDACEQMSRLQLEMQADPNGTPDVGRIKRLAADLSEAENEWRGMLTRMSLVDDFQAREYYKMTAAWAERQGESLETIGNMMRWQADCMVAFADGRPPLPPPPGIDMEKLARQQMQAQSNGPSSMMSQISAAQSVDAAPFTGG